MTKWNFTNKEKTKIKDEFGNVWDFDYIVCNIPADFMFLKVARTHECNLNKELSEMHSDDYLSDEELETMRKECKNSGIISNERIDEIIDIMKKNEVATVTHTEIEELERISPRAENMFNENGLPKIYQNYFGTFNYSIENIQKVVDSLKNCRNCFNVYFSENCENCEISDNIKNCKNCNHLTRCDNCVDSINLTNSINCRNCETCDGLINCIGMEKCHDCKNCSNCTRVDSALNCHNCFDIDSCYIAKSDHCEKKYIDFSNPTRFRNWIYIVRDEFYSNKDNKDCKHLKAISNCENCIGGHYFENLKDFNLWQTENALEILKKHRKIPSFLGNEITPEDAERSDKYVLTDGYYKKEYQKKPTLISRLFGRKR